MSCSALATASGPRNCETKPVKLACEGRGGQGPVGARRSVRRGGRGRLGGQRHFKRKIQAGSSMGDGESRACRAAGGIASSASACAPCICAWMTPGAPAHSAGRLGLHGVMSMPSGTKEPLTSSPHAPESPRALLRHGDRMREQQAIWRSCASTWVRAPSFWLTATTPTDRRPRRARRCPSARSAAAAA